MAQMQTQGGRMVEMEPPLNTDVVAVVLDNGQTVWCMKGSYKEYQPVDRPDQKIYFLVPEDHPDVEMIGFTRHIIAHHYKSL